MYIEKQIEKLTIAVEGLADQWEKWGLSLHDPMGIEDVIEVMTLHLFLFRNRSFYYTRSIELSSLLRFGKTSLIETVLLTTIPNYRAIEQSKCRCFI